MHHTAKRLNCHVISAYVVDRVLQMDPPFIQGQQMCITSILPKKYSLQYLTSNVQENNHEIGLLFVRYEKGE